MSNRHEVAEVIFENGAVGYIAKGHSFGLQAQNGAEIQQVSERRLGKLDAAQVDHLRERNRRVKGVMVRGEWRVKEKPLVEQIEEGILTEAEADKIDRDRFKKSKKS